MVSESSRMSSAAEARFRIQAQPATTRAISVSALDPASDRLLGDLNARALTGATCFSVSAIATHVEEIAAVDLAVMIAVAGADVPGIALIGEACSDRRVPTATFVIRNASTTEAAVSKTLAQVRPWSLMVVVASEADYVEDVLRSFR